MSDVAEKVRTTSGPDLRSRCRNHNEWARRDHDRYTHLFPSDIDALVRRLDDIRARNLAAQTRPRDQSRGIELGGR